MTDCADGGVCKTFAELFEFDFGVLNFRFLKRDGESKELLRGVDGASTSAAVPVAAACTTMVGLGVGVLGELTLGPAVWNLFALWDSGALDPWISMRLFLEVVTDDTTVFPSESLSLTAERSFCSCALGVTDSVVVTVPAGDGGDGGVAGPGANCGNGE
jgi:hypothetical protein